MLTGATQESSDGGVGGCDRPEELGTHHSKEHNMKPHRKAAVGALLMGATLTGGALGASMFSSVANAQTGGSTSSSSAPATAPGTPAQQPDPSKGGHIANGITETVLTGDTATKVSTAAQAAVPDGTIQRVENDAEGATYEAHMVKADGSRVTVKVNADFSVAGVEDGM
jgi:hypothetical protein